MCWSHQGAGVSGIRALSAEPFIGNVSAVQVPYKILCLAGSSMEVIDFICFYGGRCRIRTCDFHRVKVALYR